jgi:DNA-binding NarL/FixJ family response regulator
MRTASLENLFLEEIRDIRSVKQQILDAMAQIANGVSADRLGQALMTLLETTEHHVERLDRIFHEVKPALCDGRIFPHSLAQRVRGALERTTSRVRELRPTGYSRLTSRETEVLQLIAEGYANKQIAAELAISIKTVEKHRQRMMAKLDLHDTAGVTRFAISAGVVEV